MATTPVDPVIAFWSVDWVPVIGVPVAVVLYARRGAIVSRRASR